MNELELKKMANEVICLPIHHELTYDQQTEIINLIKEFHG